MLGLLPTMTTANNATRNMGVQVFVQVSFKFFWTYTQKWVCKPDGNSNFSILGSARLSLTVVTLVYIPINNVQRFQSLHIILNNICYFHFSFIGAILKPCEMASHSGSISSSCGLVMIGTCSAVQFFSGEISFQGFVALDLIVLS